MSATCARFLHPRNPPALLPLLARLPTHNPTIRLQFQQQVQQLRYASKKAGKAAPKKKIPPPPKTVAKTTPPPPQTPKYFSLAESLGSSGKERIIIYACNNRLFIFGCYGLVGGMVAWSVYTWNTNIANRRPGIPNWVVSVTYVSISAMLLLAGLVAYYPTRIVQVIHVVPIPGTARTPPSVSIILHQRPLLPTLPMRKIQVPSPDRITLMEPLQPLQPLLISKHVESEMEDTRSVLAKIRHGITGAPFKTFDFFRKALSTGGFVGMRVDGEGKYRLSKDGWVWDRRGVDRLFKAYRGI